ncbi:hypothetical protein AAES_161573 [Amazona aestiva]|uniref:Uncharacterized protein n=1 Tax=Amazona aestiva TaxID=12930 RepID=A0A0Q3LZB2_AMAAE|nr:hypothetical protein AAES_161573 [Amazona aestiva]
MGPGAPGLWQPVPRERCPALGRESRGRAVLPGEIRNPSVASAAARPEVGGSVLLQTKEVRSAESLSRKVGSEGRGRKNGIEHTKQHVKFIFMQDVIWRTKYTSSGHGR